MITTNNTLGEKEELFSHFSDTHKELYGFRPRFGSDWSVADLRTEIELLNQAIRQEILEEENIKRIEAARSQPSPVWTIGEVVFGNA